MPVAGKRLRGRKMPVKLRNSQSTATIVVCWTFFVSQIRIHTNWCSAVPVVTALDYDTTVIITFNRVSALSTRVSVNVRNQPAANSLTVPCPRCRAVLAFAFLAIVMSTLNKHKQCPGDIKVWQWSSQTCHSTAQQQCHAKKNTIFIPAIKLSNLIQIS